jgi:hypothetical protein
VQVVAGRGVGSFFFWVVVVVVAVEKKNGE